MVIASVVPELSRGARSPNIFQPLIWCHAAQVRADLPVLHANLQA